MKKQTADEETKAEFSHDPRYVQWNDIAKSYFILHGEMPHFSEVRKLMQPQIDAGLIEETGYRGWYKFSEKGWQIFTVARQTREEAA